MMLLASTTSPQVVFRSSPRYWVKFSDPAWTTWWDTVYYKEHSEFDDVLAQELQDDQRLVRATAGGLPTYTPHASA